MLAKCLKRVFESAGRPFESGRARQPLRRILLASISRQLQCDIRTAFQGCQSVISLPALWPRDRGWNEARTACAAVAAAASVDARVGVLAHGELSIDGFVVTGNGNDGIVDRDVQGDKFRGLGGGNLLRILASRSSKLNI
jgi:hypothetical protein